MSVVGVDIGTLNSVIAATRNRGVDVISDHLSSSAYYEEETLNKERSANEEKDVRTIRSLSKYERSTILGHNASLDMGGQFEENKICEGIFKIMPILKDLFICKPRVMIQTAFTFGRSMQPDNPDEMQAFEIPGFLGQHKQVVNALGDYCAKHNFIREEYALRLGLQFNRNKFLKIAIGSGKTVTTSGVARTTFRFQKEKETYPDTTFHILPNCIHDVILGKAFLKATSTFSNLANRARRVTMRILKGIKQRHFLFSGDTAPCFIGLVNGTPQDALADSGAKVLVMDEDYAQSMGLVINRDWKHRTKLQFVDQSTAYTSGMTYGVSLEFGSGGKGKRHMLDFHILKNAPANVILSDTFLFDTEAYAQYDCFLIDDDDDTDEDGYFFAIDVIPEDAYQLELDMSSPENMRHAEDVLRGKNEDRIDNMSPEEQDEAWRIENERRDQWKRRFSALQLQQASPQNLTSTTSNMLESLCPPLHLNPLSSPQLPASDPTSQKRRRWRFKLSPRKPTSTPP